MVAVVTEHLFISVSKTELSRDPGDSYSGTMPTTLQAVKLRSGRGDLGVVLQWAAKVVPRLPAYSLTLLFLLKRKM